MRIAERLAEQDAAILRALERAQDPATHIDCSNLSSAEFMHLLASGRYAADDAELERQRQVMRAVLDRAAPLFQALAKR